MKLGFEVMLITILSEGLSLYVKTQDLYFWRIFDNLDTCFGSIEEVSHCVLAKLLAT